VQVKDGEPVQAAVASKRWRLVVHRRYAGAWLRWSLVAHGEAW
jgi:hypothetical protein